MIRESFNSGWNIMCDEKSSLGSMQKNIKLVPVQLPHDAMIHEKQTKETPNKSQTGFYPGKQYIYVKRFMAPLEWSDKTVLVEFEGVYQTAMVYLNGHLVAQNKYGYSNFYVKLDDYLKVGEENEIRVIADNSAMSNSRWYSGSGIYRNVKIMTGAAVHILADGVKITTISADAQAAILEAKIRIRNQERRKETVWIHTKMLRDEICVSEEMTKVTMLSNSEETVYQSFYVESPDLWSCEDPNLYTCVIEIKTEEILDVARETFGIRTMTVDAKRGLLMNGKNVKLRGTCIHHDNGVIGAATFGDAEARRVRQLKQAGFNSIRSAHHPASKELLEACDKYGVLVMDELSDMWTYHKNPHDFADHFMDCWETEVERMVDKDYNHPSVILYSVGNEIPEIGLDSGARLKRKICNKFRSLDHTRYTTDGMNGSMAITYGCGMESIIKELLPNTVDMGKAEGANALNALNAYMNMTASDSFAVHPRVTEALEESTMASDITGLNYLTGRHLLEKELHPNKTLIGAETYPADIVRLWKLVKEHPHILGDFTWTGYDYLGEAGCGIFHYDGTMNFSNRFPERAAYIGDIDLIGYRRPISYYREIVYGLRKEPYIAVERLNRYGMKSSKTAWMFKDNIASWTWYGYEGKSAVVDVYSDSEEVELFLNGESLGRKPAGEGNNYMATYDMTYMPGELLAVSYTNGKEAGRTQLVTAADDVRIEAAADRKQLHSNSEELAYITIKLTDKNGIANLFLQKDITIQVEGPGVLQGFGSANPESLEGFTNTTCRTYDGYLLAVIRAKDIAGRIRVSFTAEGCEETAVEIPVV